MPRMNEWTGSENTLSFERKDVNDCDQPMDDRSFEGTVVLEKLAELGKVDMIGSGLSASGARSARKFPTAAWT